MASDLLNSIINRDPMSIQPIHITQLALASQECDNIRRRLDRAVENQVALRIRQSHDLSDAIFLLERELGISNGPISPFPPPPLPPMIQQPVQPLPIPTSSPLSSPPASPPKRRRSGRKPSQVYPDSISRGFQVMVRNSKSVLQRRSSARLNRDKENKGQGGREKLLELDLNQPRSSVVVRVQTQRLKTGFNSPVTGTRS
ncbi:hypothetical protein C8J56DRAFT_1052878 [Mycena floridula]|nr:hypothetical protein C8J56DRAFT_1052878 [Mycena floridula]